MRKDNTLQFRVSSDRKEKLQGMADSYGITMSDLFSLLSWQNGPKEFTRLVMSVYGVDILNRLGLSKDAINVLQQDPEAVTKFGNLFRLSVAADMCEINGDLELLQAYQREVEIAESIFYRTYGKATKNQEQPTSGREVTDAI